MIVGIDLGTTNSLVSAWTENGVVLVPNEFGEYLTPSVVSFDGKEAIVGKIAKERLITHPEVTACEFKRQMGRPTNYRLGKGGTLSPIDLSAIVLKKLISDAEKFFNEKVDSAVISVPAYFDDHQREATRLAGIKAGVKVTQLVNEPSAAALSYHFENMDQDEKFIVFDFGGGTLDVTVVDAFANMVEICNISGDNSLGGKDFNEAIALDICARFGINWDSLNKKDKAILINYGESIKIRLTSEDNTRTSIVFNGNTYEYELDQQKLIDISASVFRRLTLVLKRLMNDSGLSPEGVSGVVMVGGSSKMPSVRAYMESLFPGKIMVDPKGDVAICRGAGIVTGINKRADGVKDIIMTDICPFSLGVGIVGDEMSVIIPKNQILPCSKRQRYRTIANMQKAIKFEIYQGEKLTASSNLKLDTIDIPVPPMRKGEAYADVRFSYDLNGIFDIDIHCPLNGAEVHRSRGAASGLADGELNDIRIRMEELKQDPREIPEIKFLLEKSLRLYEEGNQFQREYLAQEIEAFNAFLDVASVPDCKKAAMTFSLRLNRVEESMFAFDVEQGNLWKEFLEENLEENQEENPEE